MAMFALLIPALLLFLAVFLLIFRRARTKAPARAMLRNRIYRWRVSSSAKPLEGRA
jgi:preprotein translocase subunit YajC